MKRKKIEVEEYLTTHEAAQYLHVTPTTVIQYCKSDLLDYMITPGGHRRILLKSINALIDRCRQRKNEDVS